MSDYISRQVVLDTIDKYILGRPEGDNVEVRELLKLIMKIYRMPSAQPKKQASDEIYGMMKDYYFKHRNDHDESWQGGFAKCMNLIPNTYERREDG